MFFNLSDSHVVISILITKPLLVVFRVTAPALVMGLVNVTQAIKGNCVRNVQTTSMSS